MSDLIDPGYYALLEQQAESGVPPRHALSTAGARAVMEAGPEKYQYPVGAVQDVQIEGHDGDIPIRLYRPDGPGPFPVLVYLHGGGWVRGTIDAVDAKCRALAHKSGVMIASVGYRLAPEHPFPAAVQDSRRAVEWIAEFAPAFAADPNRIAVGGMSAGGNLTAVLALWFRDHSDIDIAYQLLLNPVTDYHPDLPSYSRFDRSFWMEECPPGAGGYPLSVEDMIWYWNRYLRDPVDAHNPYVSPLRAPHVGGTPPATVVVSELDPLRDEGVAYAERLEEADVPVEIIEYDGVFHSFVAVFSELERADAALDDIAHRISSALA